MAETAMSDVAADDVVVVDQPLRGAVREAAALRIQHAARKSARDVPRCMGGGALHILII